MPLYNGERYLNEQLQSLLDQSWADFELFIMDDGSVDGSLDIATGFARRDSRIRLLSSRGNAGQKSRLAQLVAASQSPLIAISDQDDVWHPQKLERLVASLGNAAMAFGRSELIDEYGRPLGPTLLEANGAIRRPGDRLSLLFRPQVSGHALLGRREVFTEAAFRSAEPYDWLLSLNAEFSRGITYDDQAVVYHRMHAGNSYNDVVLARLNPLRLRVRHIRRALKKLGGRRARFVAGMEFLSRSEIIRAEDRTVFRQVAGKSRAAWFGAHARQRLSPLKLQKFILEALEPFAGSRNDWRTTVSSVRFLCLVPLTGVIR